MTDTAVKILAAPLGKTHLFFLGQAGFAIKSKRGQLLGTDLYLSACVERAEGHVGFKRLQPSPIHAGDLEFDCLIATHPHWDHFDMDSMPQIMANGHTYLIASVDCANAVERLRMGSERISYAKIGDVFDIGDFHIACVYCDHGTGAPDAFGVIITVDGKRIYIAGDTSLHLEKVPEFLKDGPIDVMIAPINGAYGNLNEAECVQLSMAVKPGLLIPCHYGMFAAHGGNPWTFMQELQQKNGAQPYLLMATGEKLTLD